jgi:hypothetical protein
LQYTWLHYIYIILECQLNIPTIGLHSPNLDRADMESGVVTKLFIWMLHTGVAKPDLHHKSSCKRLWIIMWYDTNAIIKNTYHDQA